LWGAANLDSEGRPRSIVPVPEEKGQPLKLAAVVVQPYQLVLGGIATAVAVNPATTFASRTFIATNAEIMLDSNGRQETINEECKQHRMYDEYLALLHYFAGSRRGNTEQLHSTICVRCLRGRISPAEGTRVRITENCAT
jgi:hypothetical protein